MQDNDITITIKANAAQFAAAVAGVVSSAKTMGSTISKEAKAAAEATSRLTDSFDGLRNGVGIAMKATGLAIVAGLGASAMASGNFESSLSQLQQAAGATSSEMQQMTQRAKELGKDTDLAGVTASSAAGAMVELAKAGLSVKDTIAASKGVMSLAKAGNLDFAEAATIAASALNAFGLEGKDATKVADALAAGANASQADLSDLALGLQQSATVAKQFKLSINENVTALALFANNGIKGSDAGTSLKTMLIALANPTDEAAGLMKQLGFNAYDANGKFVGLEEMSRRLAKSTAGLTDQQKQAAFATIFGSDAFRAAAVLADNAGDSYTKMSGAVGQAGAAQKAAAAQLGPFEKSMENFKNAVSDIGLTVGEKLLPPLTDFVTYAAQNVGPMFDFLSKNGQPIANGLIAIGVAFATIRTAGMVSDFSKATKSLDLFIGAKNANGIRAIGDGFKGIAGGAKSAGTAIGDASKSIASSAADISKKGVTATTSWIKGAATTSAQWIANMAKIVASAAVTAAKSVAHAVVAASAWTANAIRMAAVWAAQMTAMAAKSFWLGLSQQSPATAAALVWIANSIKMAAVWVANLVVMAAQSVAHAATIGAQAVVAGAAWVAQAVRSGAAWVAQMIAASSASAANAAAIAGQAIVAGANWVAQPVIIAGAWIANFARMTGAAVAHAVKSGAQAAISGGAWVKQAALAAGAWLLNFAKMLPMMIGTAVGMVANAAIAAGAWIAGAVATAAAWVIANAAMLGIWGLIIAAVIGAVALIVANWSSISAFFVGIFKAITDAVNSAINWVKGNWPLLLAILTGPIGLAVLWIINNWETVKQAFANAWAFIQSVWSNVTGFFGGLWNGIVNIFSGVGNFFANMFNGAWNNIRNAFSSMGGFFSGLWNSIVNIFGNIGTAIGNGISGAVKGVVNSILTGAENIINGFIGAINGAIGTINKIPGVHIGNLGTLHLPRLATGGIVPATPGGRNITVAEGGQNEWVVPEPKMASLVSQVLARTGNSNAPASSGGNSYKFDINITVQNDGSDFSDSQAVAMAKKIVRALKAQGLSIDDMGALR